MRRLAPIVGLVVLVCAAAATAATDPRLARERHTVSDLDIAGNVVLTRPEMPGWRASRIDPNDEELPRCPQMRFDESDLVETGEALSPAFSRNVGKGLEVIFTASGIYRTKRMSEVAWKRSDTKVLPACVAQYLATSYSTPAGKLRVVEARYMRFPRVAPRAVHIRIVLRNPNGSLLYADTVGLMNGRLQVGVNTLSEGHPFPTAILQDVALRIGQRMARSVPVA